MVQVSSHWTRPLGGVKRHSKYGMSKPAAVGTLKAPGWQNVFLVDSSILSNNNEGHNKYTDTQCNLHYHCLV